MTKINDEQQAALDALAEADLRWREARVTERKIALVKAEERVLAFKVDRDRLAAKAREKGVPVLRIASDGLHTTDTKSARKAIEHGQAFLDAAPVKIEEPARPEVTEPEAELEAPTPDAQREEPIMVDDDMAVVRMLPEDVKPYGITIEHPASHFFTLEDGAVVPVFGDDEDWEHPVVRAVMGMNDEWRKRVLAALEAGE